MLLSKASIHQKDHEYNSQWLWLTDGYDHVNVLM